MTGWPTSPADLLAVQEELAAADPEPWPGPAADRPLRLGGCFACFPRGSTGPGGPGDAMWVAAVVLAGRTLIASHTVRDETPAGYTAGLLALREGPALEAAVRGLEVRPEVLLVNATGRDHPRRAGLATHLGAALHLPTVGVTHRPLSAAGDWPADRAGATAPLILDGRVVGYWVRTRPGTRPLAVGAAWRTTPELAVRIVLGAVSRARTPEPLRRARHVARSSRSLRDAPA